MCTKVTHLTHAGAMIHAEALRDKTGQMPKIYKCQQCGGIHVGYTAAAVRPCPKRAGGNTGKISMTDARNWQKNTEDDKHNG